MGLFFKVQLTTVIIGSGNGLLPQGIWSNVDADRGHNMAFLGHKEAILISHQVITLHISYDDHDNISNQR